MEFLATIENFFEMNGKKYHEYMFMQKCEFTDEEDKNFSFFVFKVLQFYFKSANI